MDIDLKLHSECCGAEVDVDTYICTKCKKVCDWGVDLEGCDSK